MNIKQLTKKKIAAIVILSIILIFILFFAILCFVTMGMYSPAYLGRVLSHIDSSVSDINFFPKRIINSGDSKYAYEIELNKSPGSAEIEYSKGKKTIKTKLADFVKSSDTMSFIIVKDDNIVFEEYSSGYAKEDENTSFSMSKSVVSLLIGKAIEEGYIESVTQPISDYIEEFKNDKIGNITIEELLLMRSDIEYSEDKFLWFGDDSLTYWHPDLRHLALAHKSVSDKYNGLFHYNNYHPLLLGLILEKCTGMSVSKYFEEKFWKPIGAEKDASWSLDSESSGFEKMESGLNFYALDFVKLGSMILHGGTWNGKEIINEDWLKQSTLSKFPINQDEYKGTFLEDKNIAYKYMWYSCPDGKGGYDIFAWGKSDQILYISPANNTVILRTGKSDGGVKNWIEIMKQISQIA